MKTLITAFFLPPGVFLWPLLLLMLSAIGWKRWRRSIFVGVVFMAFWLACTPNVGRFLSAQLLSDVRGSQLSDVQDVDLIVALTADITFLGHELGWIPSLETYRRVAVARDVQQAISAKGNKRVPVLISGGHTHGVQNPSEGDVAKHFFDKQSAELTPMLVEDASNNTYESALQVAGLVQQRRAQNVLLVTSEVHMLRSLASYRAMGIDAMPFPVFFVPRGDLGGAGWLPSKEGILLTTKALYEYYGLVQYLLTGKIRWEDIIYREGRA